MFEVVGNSTAQAFFTLGTSVSAGNNAATVNVVVRDGAYLRRDQSPSFLVSDSLISGIFKDLTCTLLCSYLCIHMSINTCMHTWEQDMQMGNCHGSME